MRIRNGEAGQSLALVAISLVALIGMLGLAVDVGYMRYVRRELQTAADASALAGAIDVYYGDVAAAAQAAASENGFANGASGVTVSVYNPPHDGPYASASYPTYVEAVVTKTTVPTFFSRIFGISNVTLSASSVAAGGTNCIYGLDTLSGGALNVTIAVIDSACGVVDNANLTGLGGLLCAPSIQLVGTNNIVFGGTCGSGFRGATPVKIAAPAADPFASLPKPAVSPPPTVPASCTAPNCFTTAQTISGTATINQLPIYEGGTQIVNVPAGQVVTINPGTYFGPASGGPAFLIKNSTVVFNPGTYYIESRAAGQPGIQLNSAGRNQVSFGAGTYTVYGGITDISATGFTFGSAINWNSGSSPSLFILDGGGLKLEGNLGSSGSANTSSGGVTFYNTGTAAAGTPTTYGPIVNYFDFQGFCGSNCQLQAPTSGTYYGILFFQDSNNNATAACPGSGSFGSATANACFAANFSAGGTISHAGAYYFPGAHVAFNFDFGAGAPYSFLVANDISWFFAFTFNRNYNNLPNGSPIKQGSAVIVQ